MDTSFRLAMADVLYKHGLRPYLFGKDAEGAHAFTIGAFARIQNAGLLPILRLYRSTYFRMPIRVFGTEWRNPVGVAAGFDKHANVIPALDALGFGSGEIGTFTPRPQFGNPQPRVFRYPEISAIINRYGFNSVGAEVGARNYHWLCSRYQIDMPIGISIGKNKETPDEQAVGDYLTALGYFLPVIRKKDWLKINISSPNTPGLRNIFERLDDFLFEFVEGAMNLASKQGKEVPLLVLKIPPDGLSPKQLEYIVEVAARHGFAGVEATNTTVNEEIKARYHLSEQGGVSGEPLRLLATYTLGLMEEAARKYGIDLVGVGGISRGEHAIEKRESGAKAVQVYTGLVFRGPILIHEILQGWRNGG